MYKKCHALHKTCYTFTAYINEFVHVCVTEAGPELIMTGRCPPHVCKNRRQQELAKWMILKIQEKYPELFYNAVHDLSRRG